MEKETTGGPFMSDETPEAKRAQDIAYTINHALACTATDFIDPYFGNLTQRWLGKRFSIGCGHDHHDHHHSHGRHDHSHHGHHHHHHHPPPPHSHLKHWWIGEVAGDFGAVPVTVAAQCYLPGMMNGLRRFMEPLLGGFFRRGAERSAAKWAQAHGVTPDSPEYREYAQAIYRHEVDHLPQALLWTASSIAINLGTQRAIGNRGPFWQLAAGKAVGATISAGLVVGGRGLSPGTAERWDRWTSETLFLPATKTIGAFFGVREEDVTRMAEQQKALTQDRWAERVKEPSLSRDR